MTTSREKLFAELNVIFPGRIFRSHDSTEFRITLRSIDELGMLEVNQTITYTELRYSIFNKLNLSSDKQPTAHDAAEVLKKEMQKIVNHFSIFIEQTQT